MRTMEQAWHRTWLAVVVLAGLVLPVRSADTPWKAGVAVVSITPAQPVPMAGYAARTTPYERVEHDLFAKALALEDGRGNRAVLVTTDLVGIPAAFAEPICEGIGARTGLARSQILLSSSHTHSAPLLTGDEQTRYENMEPAHGRLLVAYTRQLQAKIIGVAVAAMAELKPAALAHGTGVEHFVMNRREFTSTGVILGVNPRGLVDRSVPVLRVADGDGRLLAVLFSFACHNTTLTGSNHSLCGDYAGFAQLHVEKMHPGVQAMFMMGCGGDANPYPRGTMELARAHGETLGREVGRVLAGKLKPVGGPLSCRFGRASLPLQSFAPAELQALASGGPSWRRRNARELLEMTESGRALPSVYESPVSVWQFGKDLTLVGLSGEVVVDYVPLLEKALGPLNLWLTAYCHDVFGYVPSDRVLEEGGYECRGLYTGPGFFAPGVQEVLVKKVRELASP